MHIHNRKYELYNQTNIIIFIITYILVKIHLFISNNLTLTYHCIVLIAA